MENIFNTITSIATASAVFLNVASPPQAQLQQAVLAKRTMSLENRYPDAWVNKVFKDNILLTIAYMKNEAKPGLIDEKKPFSYEFTLKPREMFAFHDDVLTEYKGKVAKTSNAHFNYQEGFKSDGYLFGDGVCHLASLMYWAAKEAKLEAVAPTNHDFREIPDVPREYGVSIYNAPGETGANSKQNLYIKNNQNKSVVFRFAYNEDALKLTVFSVN
ncbi:MAG: VanW family protein [Candidatus Levyibacteriota bacterium]|nr:MAG: VanW family protein [Candidatus Levybacteria bacterium]